MRTDRYGRELKLEQPIEDVISVIRDYRHFIDKLKNIGIIFTPVIHITGGDPLLRPDIFEILDECKLNRLKVGILGNPDLITIELTKKLVDHGVISYQLSVDGPSSYHDKVRNKYGSYFNTLKAIKCLKDGGMRKIFIMCNVTKANIHLVPETYVNLINNDITEFVFARVACIGNAKDKTDTNIEPHYYKKLLSVMDRIRDDSVKISTKDPLWAAYFSEKGKLEPSPIDIEGGCQVGISLMCIMADGHVHACRRMNSPIGKVPEDSLYNIFVNSDLLSKFRNFSNYKKCGTCDLVNNCRGCPAIAYGKTGSYFDDDPQCWKK